jgi:ech hydrogenase subunit B
MDFTNDINCGGGVIMLEIILWFIGIIIIVPIIYLTENFILNAIPGQKRTYLLQPIYRLIKHFSKTDYYNRPLTRWFPVGACLFALITLYFVAAGENILLIISGLTMMELFVLVGACSTKEPYGIMAAQRGIARLTVWSFTLMTAAASLYKVTETLQLSRVIQDSSENILLVRLPLVTAGLFTAAMIKGNLGYFDFGINANAMSFLDTALYTPYGGRSLGVVQLTQWIETGIWLKLISYFLPWKPWISFLVSTIFYLAAMLLSTIVPRMSWKKVMTNSWIWAGGLPAINYIWLYML